MSSEHEPVEQTARGGTADPGNRRARFGRLPRWIGLAVLLAVLLWIGHVAWHARQANLYAQALRAELATRPLTTQTVTALCAHGQAASDSIAAIDADLRMLRGLLPSLGWVPRFGPDLVIYQAGADTHVDDPLGGLLTSDQMRERDSTMFAIARRLSIPLTWNLAGGYQIEADGSIPRVVELHLNTFEEALKVWHLL